MRWMIILFVLLFLSVNDGHSQKRSDMDYKGTDVVVSGNYVYVGTDVGLIISNLKGERLSFFKTECAIHDIVVKNTGDRALLAVAEDGVLEVDISDPTNPVRIRSINFPNSFDWVSGVEWVYEDILLATNKGLFLFNFYEKLETIFKCEYARKVLINNGITYLMTRGHSWENGKIVALDGRKMLWEMDVPTPENLVISNVNNMLYVACNNAGMIVLDISNSGNRPQKQKFEFENSALFVNDLAVADSIVVVAGTAGYNHDNYHYYYVLSSSSFKILGRADGMPMGDLRGVDVSSQKIYFSGDADNLTEILKIRDR